MCWISLVMKGLDCSYQKVKVKICYLKLLKMLLQCCEDVVCMQLMQFFSESRESDLQRSHLHWKATTAEFTVWCPYLPYPTASTTMTTTMAIYTLLHPIWPLPKWAQSPRRSPSPPYMPIPSLYTSCHSAYRLLDGTPFICTHKNISCNKQGYKKVWCLFPHQ